MECSLFALITCFSWSNLYIDSDLMILDHGVQSYTQQKDMYAWFDDSFHYIKSDSATRSSADNPYGRLVIGYQVELKTVTLSLQAEHTSSLATDGDRGVNGLAIKARWFPFR